MSDHPTPEEVKAEKAKRIEEEAKVAPVADLERTKLLLQVATMSTPTNFPGMESIHGAALRELKAINEKLAAVWSKKIEVDKVEEARVKAVAAKEALDKAEPRPTSRPDGMPSPQGQPFLTPASETRNV